MVEPSEIVFDPREILRVLREHGVEFTVVGGIAVQAHGHGRATRDLDVIPRPDVTNLSRVGEALAELDAGLWLARGPVDVTDPHLLKRAQRVPLITRYGRLDLLHIESTSGAPRTYAELRESALELEVGGVVVVVAGLDDLIRMKRAAGRDQDLADIAALTRTDEELEREAREAT